MTMSAFLDRLRDEVQFNWALANRVRERLRLEPGKAETVSDLVPVDVAGTNEGLTLGGSSLTQFCAVPVGSKEVLRLADMTGSYAQLTPEKLNIVLLAGGVSFRTGGRVNPLLSINDPRTDEERTLIDRQYRRIRQSCLATSRVFVVGNPFNETSLNKEISRWSTDRYPQVYSSGLAPLLSPDQSCTGELRFCRDSEGEIAFNPAGHFEALRWLILNGFVCEMADDEVVTIVSYSNWGDIYTEETLLLARLALELGRDSKDFLFLGEVNQCPVRDQQPGSFLTVKDGDPSALRLIKYNYGPERFRVDPDRPIFMSTNTLYFYVGGLLFRLHQAAMSLGIGKTQTEIGNLFSATRTGQQRAELSAVVDKAFPINPQLIATHKGKTVENLRIERDLDQVSLMAGALYRAVEVRGERAIFLKLPTDFDDPQKKSLILGSA